jgi:hypothetical protein
MIQNSPGKIDACRELSTFVKIFVDGIAARKECACDFDFVADFQRADNFFGNGGIELNHEE